MPDTYHCTFNHGEVAGSGQYLESCKDGHFIPFFFVSPPKNRGKKVQLLQNEAKKANSKNIHTHEYTKNALPKPERQIEYLMIYVAKTKDINTIGSNRT